MTRTFRAFAAAFALLVGAPTAADEAADIQAVIADQLAAFQEDDWVEAFEFASPMIRGMFRTPENFGRMVRGGYGMVWRPESVETGPLEQGPGGPVQVMIFEDADGVRWAAAYEMVQVDGAWRINGVSIRRMRDLAV